MSDHPIRLKAGDFLQVAMGILASGHRLRFMAHGGSMYPLVRSGDIVEVKPVNASSVRLGDMLLCSVGGERAVVHRVIGLATEDGRVVFFTKGDALRSADAPVYPEQVLGCVTAIRREGRTLRIEDGWRRLMGRPWARLWPLSYRLRHMPRPARYIARKLAQRLSTF